MASADSWLWVFRAGAFLILLASLLFMLGFATNHWHGDDTLNYGLWERCVGARCSTHEGDDLAAYHIATQAMQIVALFFYAAAPVAHFFVYICKKAKETGWRSRIFDIMYSIGALFHLASVIVFGLEHSDGTLLSWSYRMNAAAVPISLTGVTLVIISRSKALQKFRFRTSNKLSNRKKSKVGVGGSVSGTDSRSSTPRSYNSHRSTKSVIIRQREQHQHKSRGEDSRHGNQQEVNVNINIHGGASSMDHNTPFSTQSSKMVFAGGVPTHVGGASNLPPEGAYREHSHNPHQSTSFDPDLHDPSLTTVRPAPNSDASRHPQDNDHYPHHPPQQQLHQQQRHSQEYQQRLQFGPSEKHRALNPSDGHDLHRIINSNADPNLDLPSSRGLPPTAPPSDQSDPNDEFYVDDQYQKFSASSAPLPPQTSSSATKAEETAAAANYSSFSGQDPHYSHKSNPVYPTRGDRAAFSIATGERDFSTPDSSPPPYSEVVGDDDLLSRSLSPPLSIGGEKQPQIATTDV